MVCKKCKKYDLIFMDIEMPILTGYEAIKELQASFKIHGFTQSERPHIVACTAHGGD